MFTLVLAEGNRCCFN